MSGDYFIDQDKVAGWSIRGLWSKEKEVNNLVKRNIGESVV